MTRSRLTLTGGRRGMRVLSYSKEKALKSLQTQDFFHSMVGVTGLEPTTSWSRTRRATNCATPRCMEQVKGIEPSHSAWEADVLPLNYTCMD